MTADLSRLSELGAPEEAIGALADFLEAVEGTLPVVGVYLYGSLTRDAYRPPASDVDLLVVMSDPIPDSVIPELQAAQARTHSAARIDAIAATREQVTASTLPTPLDLVLPPDAQPQRHPENRGMMFPLDRQDAWECGVRLSGALPREVVPPSPKELLIASLTWVFPHLADNFKNPELMLCRATYAFVEGRLCSKPEAGAWALTALDSRWHPAIRAALAARQEGGTQRQCSREELAGFERACAALIEEATGVTVSARP